MANLLMLPCMINLSMNQRITILFFTLLRTISQVLEHIESHHKHTQSLIFYSAPWNFKVCFSEAMTKSKLVSLNEKLMCQSVGWNNKILWLLSSSCCNSLSFTMFDICTCRRPCCPFDHLSKILEADVESL